MALDWPLGPFTKLDAANPVLGPREDSTFACPRAGRFDSVLVEPGPPAVLTGAGIVLLYHGKNAPPEEDGTGGDPRLPAYTYGVGQLLLDPKDPTAVLARPTGPFLLPDRDYEITGQVGNVCFAEGLVPLGDRWLLYYGTADSKIAAASAPRRPHPDAEGV